MQRKFTRLVTGTALVLALSYIPANADTTTHSQHDKKMNHDQMNQTDQSKKKPEILPKEPGQGAFATIAEIVAMLSNDPATDWSKVDIDGLREHLIDMDEVSLRAKATSKISDGKIVFTVSGTGRTLQAIHAMVPPHSGVLSRTTAWKVEGKNTDTGAIMTLSSNNPAVLKIIKALGFYGVMATGAHHQAHHLAMAKGDQFAHSHN